MAYRLIRHPVSGTLMRRTSAVLSLCALILLSACQIWPKAGKPPLPANSKSAVDSSIQSLPIDPQTVKGGAQMAQAEAKRQQQIQVLRHSPHPWVASAPLPLLEEQRLPPLFYEPFTLNYSMEETGMSLDTLAHRLSQIARTPVRILPDIYAGIEQSIAIEESELLEEEEKNRREALKGDQTQRRPVSARANRFEVQEIPPHLLRWRGNLRGFLNHLTDRLDLSWSYEDGTIVFSRFQTEVFELAMFPTRGRFDLKTSSTGMSGGRSGGSSSSSSGGSSGAAAGSVGGALSMDFSEQSQMETYDSTIKLIESMVAAVPGSKVFVTQGSGRVLVRSSRLMLRALREFIRTENASMTRQVLVQVDIYNVTTNSRREFGTDWTLIYQRLFPGMDVGLSSTGATGGIGVFNMPDSRVNLMNGKLTDATLAGAPRNIQSMINSLSELGYAVQHRPFNLMAMNRQWVRKSKLLSQSYLAETTAGTTGGLGGGTAVPGLKAASVTVGDQIMLMPFILENNSVMIKFSVSFSDLLGLNRIETGEGATRQLLQIPTTSIVQDNFTVSIKPGEVVAITGLGNNSGSKTRKSLTESASVLFGGSEVSENRDQHFLVFLRVVLL